MKCMEAEFIYFFFLRNFYFSLGFWFIMNTSFEFVSQIYKLIIISVFLKYFSYKKFQVVYTQKNM